RIMPIPTLSAGRLGLSLEAGVRGRTPGTKGIHRGNAMKKMTERRQGALPPVAEPRSLASVSDPVDGVLREARECDPLRITALYYCRFIAVAAYLACVFPLLAVMRKVPLGIRPRSIARWVRGRLFFRVHRPITLVPLGQERGHAYYSLVDGRILSDLESVSRLQVYEDG